jgi:hypothetical protein
VGNERYAITAAQAWSSLKTPLTASAFTVAGFSVAKATSGTASTGNIYWGIGAPTAISGACTGTVVFAPV